MQSPSFARFEKPGQLPGIRLVGAQLDGVNARGTKQRSRLSLGASLAFGEGGPLALIASVDLDDLTRFRVVEHQPPQSGQLQLVAVSDLHCDDIMPPIGLAQPREGSLR